MNCTESQDILQRRLDCQEITDHAALSQHLAECADCRLLHAAAGQLEVGLRKMPPLMLPLNLRTNIVAAAVKERAARRRQRIVLGMALAATILLAVWVEVLASESSDGVARNPFRKMRDFVAGLFSKEPATERVLRFNATYPGGIANPSSLFEEKTPSLRDSMAEAGTAMVSLTRRTADETVEQTRILTEVLPMPMNVFEAVPPMPEQPIASALQETSQRVATGFEPVTNSARRALSMLLRESPRAVNQ